MKKRFLPIPLILLTPIVLLIVVIVAGIYRFSLSDEEIMAKFPQTNTQTQVNEIAHQIFGLRLTNPITIPVPETPSVAFMERWDESQRWVMGDYDSGKERGSVALDTQLLMSLKGENSGGYISVIKVSNQGSGVFSYLALIRFDERRSRMVMVANQLLGDRINVKSLDQNGEMLEVKILNHTKNQPISEAPTESMSILFSLTEKYQLVRQ